MEDAGAVEVVSMCERALERTVDDVRFVLFHSPSVDSLCAVKILLMTFRWLAPAEPTVRMVTTLQSLRDAVEGEQQSGPRVLFFINCGGLKHELAELQLREGSVVIILDHRRPMIKEPELIGAVVRWMTLAEDQESSVGTPASLCALYIAQALYLQNETFIWYAILGETGLVQESLATPEQVKNWELQLMGHAQYDASCRISHGAQLKLPFFQHTSLWDSIRMSGAIMAKTGAWKMHDDSDLAEFVVELGIPMEKSKIPYGTFMVKYGHDLEEKLGDRGPQWGLHDLCSYGFKRSTVWGEVSAEDHARAIRSTLASCSGQCDLSTILAATQGALQVLNGGEDQLKVAAARCMELMPSLTGAGYFFSRPHRPGLRIWNLDKRQQGASSTAHWNCPLLLELIAQHAMDYSDTPVVLIGQAMNDGRVAVVGWGNRAVENGPMQQMQTIGQLMMDIGVSMQAEGYELTSVAFKTNIWWMQQKTAREYISRIKKTQSNRLHQSGHKRQVDVPEETSYKKNRSMLRGWA